MVVQRQKVEILEVVVFEEAGLEVAGDAEDDDELELDEIDVMVLEKQVEMDELEYVDLLDDDEVMVALEIDVEQIDEVMGGVIHVMQQIIEDDEVEFLVQIFLCIEVTDVNEQQIYAILPIEIGVLNQQVDEIVALLVIDIVYIDSLLIEHLLL